MKKMFFALMTMLTVSISVNAMSYEQARNEALFLTDKMAYELNLTDEQYEAAYEINLDYLMGVTGRNDVFGTYWERRNLDLSYILLEWQWNTFVAATYFYRPLYWEAGYWHFGIYRRYPHRDYFYFGRPHFYVTYHGAHAASQVITMDITESAPVAAETSQDAGITATAEVAASTDAIMVTVEAAALMDAIMVTVEAAASTAIAPTAHASKVM